MKKVILIAMVVLVVLSVGCTVQHYNPNPGENVESRIEIVDSDMPYAPNNIFAHTPGWMEFGDMYPGAEVSTWTEDKYMYLERYKIIYHKGDPICIGICNPLNYTATFEIDVINAPPGLNECNECDDGDKLYHQAPAEFLETVVVSEEVVVLEPGEMTLIYFSFVLPEDLDYPETWEFRFYLKEIETSVGGGGTVRMLFTMR